MHLTGPVLTDLYCRLREQYIPTVAVLGMYLGRYDRLLEAPEESLRRHAGSTSWTLETLSHPSTNVKLYMTPYLSRVMSLYRRTKVKPYTCPRLAVDGRQMISTLPTALFMDQWLIGYQRYSRD